MGQLRAAEIREGATRRYGRETQRLTIRLSQVALTRLRSEVPEGARSELIERAVVEHLDQRERKRVDRI